MLGTSVEKLFERYRRKGDGEALARVFDRTSPELFRLAQHLVRDPLAAEDVLQETFVVAIDGAERWDASRPLVPWLTGILAKQASSLRRKNRRELEPDRLHERVEPDPAEVAADSELSRELEAALAELPELYGDVLRRHLLDGSKPAEIASELRRAPGTVRMQLHRGLELLRRSLPASFAAGAALAALSPRGLAAVREAVVAHAHEVALAGGLGLAGAGAGGAASFVGWKLGLAAVLAALAAWTIAGPERGAPPDPDRTSQRAAVPAEPEPLAAAREGRATRSERVPLAAPGSALERGASGTAAGPRVVLVGTVTAPAGADLAGAFVEARGVARYRWPVERTLRVEPAQDGSYALDLDPLFAFAERQGALSEISVRAVHPGLASASTLISPLEAEARSGEAALRFELHADLALGPAFFVRGGVEDAAGPREGARVYLLPVRAERPNGEHADATRTLADGRFTLQVPEPGDWAVLVLEPERRPELVTFVVAPGRSVDLPWITTRPGRTVRGLVTDAGEPAAGAEVLVAWGESWVPPGNHVVVDGERFIWDGARLDRASQRLRTDGDGRFTLAGLGPSLHHVAVSEAAPGVTYVARWDRQKVVFGRDEGDLAPHLELDALWVDLVAEDPSGAVLDASVMLMTEDPEMWQARSRDGVLRMALGEYRPRSLEVRAAGHEPARVGVEPLGQERTVERRVVLAPRAEAGSLALELESAGSPLESVTVEWLGSELAPARFELDGKRARLPGLPNGVTALRLHANGAWQHYEDGLLETRLEGLAPETMYESARFERGGRLRLTVRGEAGAFLPARATLRDLSGAPLDVRFLLRSPDEQGFAPGERLSAKGPSDVHPNLPAGVYEVELSMEGRETRVLPVRVVAGEVSELDLVLR